MKIENKIIMTHVLVLSAAFNVAIVPVVYAQGTQTEALSLEEIIVTAERKETNLQTTAVSISAFSEDAIDRFQIVEATDLQKFVPALTIQQGVGAPGKVDLYLRGAGDQSGAIITSESGVGVYIDDVYMSRLSVANIEALELERIEVLRGPQGTLYGRNSMTGAIKYVTKTPDGDVGGKLAVGYGKFDAYNVRGYIEAPLIDDRLAASFSAFYRESGDWYKNTALGEDRGNREVLAINTKFALLTQGPLSGTLSLSYSQEDNDGGETVQRDPLTLESITGGFRDVQSPFDTFGENQQFRVAVDFSYEFNDNLYLRSITGFHDLDESSAFDLTGAGLLNRTLDGEVEVWNQELQLFGTAFNGSLDWILGGSLFQEQGYQTISDVVFFNARAATVLDIDSESYAAFVEGSYHFTDQLSLTAGVRYTEDEKVLAGAMATAENPTVTVPVQAVNDDRAATYRLVLDYQWSDEVFAFLSISKGFKAGSFNGLAVLDPVAFATGFDPEIVQAYETGIKADLLDNRLRTNVNIFFNDFSDLQGLNTSAAGSTTIRNIAGAEVYGIEAEFTWLASEELQLTGSVARQWDEYTDIDPGSVLDPSFKINRVSDWTASLGFEYRWSVETLDGSLGLNGHWSYRSEYFNDIINQPVVRTDDSSLVDFGGFYESANADWKITLAGKNVLSEEIYVKGLGVIRPTGIPNQPFAWSLDVRYNF